MNRGLALLVLAALSTSAFAETLKQGSLVCWGEGTLVEYLTASAERKQEMEEHECGILNIGMVAEVLTSKTVAFGGVEYSITNIVLRYQDHGQRADSVWVFSESLSH